MDGRAGDSAGRDTEPVSALLPGRVGLLVRLVARRGGRAGLLDGLHRYMDTLDTEPGTEVFVVALDPDEGDVVWLFEWFTDADALEAHRRSATFHAMMRELPGHLGAPPALVRLDPLRMHLQQVVAQGRTAEDVLGR